MFRRAARGGPGQELGEVELELARVIMGPMHRFARVAALVVLASSGSGCDSVVRWLLLDKEGAEEDCPRGRRLMLNRVNFDTFRACVAMDGDCGFIAGVLQEKEPLVRWFCK